MFKIDHDDLDRQLQAIQDAIDSMTPKLKELVEAEGRRYAATKLKSGLPFWEKSFKVVYDIHHVDDNTFIVSVGGDGLAKDDKSLNDFLGGMMEDGMERGAISNAILGKHANRASYNKGEKKNYVDVPIAQNADQLGNMTLGKNGPTVNVKAFKSADEMLKHMSNPKDVKVSNRMSGGVDIQKRYTDRVKDVIHSVEAKTKNASYVTIRRISENSKNPWPKEARTGIKALDHLRIFIDNHIQEVLDSVL